MKREKTKRQATKAEAWLSILVVVCVVGGGSAILGINLRMTLVIAAAINLIFVYSCGYSWKDVGKVFSGKVSSMSGIFQILMGIGFLVGSFMVCGTLPTLVSILASLISPSMILVLSFIMCSILAVFIASAFATMGTLGIVMFSVATVQGIDPLIAAGAVVCGSWMGQYFGPISDPLSIAAGQTDSTIPELNNIMIKHIAVPYVITAIFWVVMGMRVSGGDTAAALESVKLFISEVHANMNTNPIVLVPLILAIVLSLLKWNTALVQFASGFVALLMAPIVQGYNLTDCLTAGYTGFSTETFMQGAELSDTFSGLLNRGGMTSMADCLVFLVCALTCISVIEVIGAFDVLQSTFFKGSMELPKITIISSIVLSLFALCVADNYAESVVGPELTKRPFQQAGYSAKIAGVMSVIIGNFSQMFLPWSFCGWFSANLFGVDQIAYMKYLVFFWLVPVASIVLSFFKIGFPKMTEEEAARFEGEQGV